MNFKKSYSICTAIIHIIIVLRGSNGINIVKKRHDQRYRESWNSLYMWGEFQLPPHIGGAVGGAVGALAPPKAPLCRVGGGLGCAVGASLSVLCRLIILSEYNLLGLWTLGAG